MTKLELRQIDVELSGVQEESGKLLVSGYVNQTGQWSQPLGRENRFIERIEPGTFTRALQKGNDVHFLAEHDNAKLLASTKNGSLQLREDDKGLYMEARISPTTWGKDYHQLIQDGLLTNMSFGMQVTKDKWDKRDDGTYQRTISDLHLAEVSVVRNPAYVQSSIQALQARSIEIIEPEPVFFMEKNNNQNLEENIMTNLSEKQIKEMRALLDEAEKKKETELRTAQEVEVRDVEVDIEKQEIRGVEEFLRGNVHAPEVRAVTTGATPGSLTIPTHLSNHIVEKLQESAPLFSRTKNFTPVNGFLEILRERAIGTAGFFGEMNSASMTNDFTMDKVRLDQKRVGTAIELSQHLVNDSGIDVVNYAISLLSRRLGVTLDASILIGKKDTEFEGILKDVTFEDITAASATAITIDELLDVYNAMHPSYIGGAVWVVSRPTFNMIAKLKDGNGHYHLVRDVATTGPIYKLFGQPVLIQDAMPAPVAGERSVLFVNLGEGYATMTKKGLGLKRIADDTTQALRGSQLIVLDAYVDGKVLNPAAIKALKMKAGA
ncbi:phage major capsid protein [Bacillus wiedmannii]|uniref:Phage major capsid protein n=1 Tax=Bacillus wiedmannii TaxID=1890302 RepID=A0AA95RWY4_9BACI|nr:phage major capsid protein [Bacillus wiedmannii]WHY28104.1 phage major capsid protein [Bacillus wiedmannii]